MGLNTGNVRVWGDVNNRVITAPIGTTSITSPLLANQPTGYYDLGWITDDGLTESSAQQETKKYGWQGGGIIRVVRSQFEKSFAFAAAEENAVTLGLAYPFVTPTTVGATAEIETITITGTPTGGPFTITVPGFGSYVAVYNVATATLASALTNLIGGTVTVTGTAGSSYVITFPASLGNIAQSQVGAAFTGGSSPAISIATGTPGVNGTTTRAVVASGAQNLRQWGLYLSDGLFQKVIYVPNGEAILTGDISLKGTDDTVFAFTLETYPDSTGAFFYEITNNPAVGSGLFA